MQADYHFVSRYEMAAEWLSPYRRGNERHWKILVYVSVKISVVPDILKWPFIQMDLSKIQHLVAAFFLS